MVHTPEDVDYTMAEEMRKGAMHEFSKRQKLTEFFLTLLKRTLAFTFILVFIRWWCHLSLQVVLAGGVYTMNIREGI